MVTYTPASYTATAVPSAYELHVMKRLGCGYSPATLADVRAAGGIEPWLAAQLEPESVPEAPVVAQVDAWFSDLRRTPTQKAEDNATKRKQHYKYGLDLANWTTLRRVHSTRPVLETMLDFWANHLHVSTGDEKAYTHLYDYHLTLRQNALGRFDDLLVAASTHPAMLLYLDNFRSVRNAPNENQGRELLELHTVTTEAGYSEDMVKDSAKLLSGWTVDWGGSYEGFYNTAAHTTGAVEVLGFRHANTASDGRAACEAYLRHLARHPATARTVARRLAVRFVRDTPSDDLVAHLASVFTESGTDIKATLLALVAHPEFRASAGQKVSTPVDDLVATLKALGVKGRAPTRGYGAGSYPLHLQYHHRGLRLFSWPRPDGCPETNFEFTSGIRMLGSYRFHWDLAGGYYPKVDVSFVPARSRVPRSRLSFALYVDHLSRSLLGRPSTSRTLKAACVATGLSPSSVVTPRHAVAGWMFPHVASTLLDSPEHMTR